MMHKRSIQKKLFMNKILTFQFCFIFFFVSSCTSIFSKKQKKLRKFLENQEFQKAKDLLEKDKKLINGKNKFIYSFDLGIVLQELGNYKLSNKYLENAYSLFDNFLQKPIEEIFAFLINPNIASYRGEIHEGLFSNYFKAINFIYLNDLEKALIECKRCHNLHLIYMDKMEGKAGFTADAFFQLFMGIIYQASEDYNNAFIAYRNSLKIYEDLYLPLFNISPPKQLIKDLIFSAYMCGFDSEVENLQEKYKMKDYDPKSEENMHNSLVFWHNGLVPIKESIEINFVAVPGVAGVVNLQNKDLNIFVTLPDLSSKDSNAFLDMKFVRFAIPKYSKTENNFYDLKINLDNKLYSLEIAENIESIAIQTLNDRIKWEISKTLIRVAIKQLSQYLVSKQNQTLGLALGVFNFISEGADERSSQALPKTISYTRIKTQNPLKNISYNIYSKKAVYKKSLKNIPISKKTDLFIIRTI